LQSNKFYYTINLLETFGVDCIVDEFIWLCIIHV